MILTVEPAEGLGDVVRVAAAGVAAGGEIRHGRRGRRCREHGAGHREEGRDERATGHQDGKARTET
jgi:hypothetical protein